MSEAPAAFESEADRLHADSLDPQRQAATLQSEMARKDRQVVDLQASFKAARAAMQAELEALQVSLQNECIAHGVVKVQLDAARHEAATLAARVNAIEESTFWQGTRSLRAFLDRHPEAAVALRRSLKLVKWTLTLQLFERYKLWIAARRNRAESALLSPVSPGPAVEPLPAAVAPPDQSSKVPINRDRFALENIPKLRGDTTAADRWYDPLTPDLSIVVLNWNRSDMTLLCLQHLWERTTGLRYEIIVVDNGSGDHDIARLKQQATRARIVELGINRYFGEANNIGVESARGRYVCLLNNDAFVHEAWLEPLVQVLETDPTAGAVGPRFLYPDGQLQEAGAMIFPDGFAVQLGKSRDQNDPTFNVTRKVDYVSAACVLLRREEFLHVLGFDLAWDPAYYEDVDLCLKLRLIGLKTICCPASTVTHIENATSSNPSHGLQLHTIVSTNRAKFVARWAELLDTPGAQKPNLVPAKAATALQNSGKPRVVICTQFNITPGGGERYFLTIAEAFRDVAEVTLATQRPFSRTRILTMGRDFGLQLDQITLSVIDAVKQGPKADLAFVIGNYIFPPIAGLAKCNIHICQFPFPYDNPDEQDQGTHYRDAYNLILTYSDFVKSHAERMMSEMTLPPRQVEVLPPPVPIRPFSHRKRRQILHVGRFFTGGHCKRQDTLIEAFRKLVEAGLDAELHFAGGSHPEPYHRAYYDGLMVSAAGLPVHFHPNCSFEKLEELYADSMVYWHATGFGADLELEPQKAEHFGISVLEAMSAGCIPVVFAAGGPADIVKEGETGFLFSTIDELCARTLEIMDAMPANQIAALAAAAACTARDYSEEAFRTKVRRLAQRYINI